MGCSLSTPIPKCVAHTLRQWCARTCRRQRSGGNHTTLDFLEISPDDESVLIVISITCFEGQLDLLRDHRSPEFGQRCASSPGEPLAVQSYQNRQEEQSETKKYLSHYTFFVYAPFNSSPPSTPPPGGDQLFWKFTTRDNCCKKSPPRGFFIEKSGHFFAN